MLYAVCKLDDASVGLLSAAALLASIAAGGLVGGGAGGGGMAWLRLAADVAISAGGPAGSGTGAKPAPGVNVAVDEIESVESERNTRALSVTASVCRRPSASPLDPARPAIRAAASAPAGLPTVEANEALRAPRDAAAAAEVVPGGWLSGLDATAAAE
jgi:hypothetical protein